MVMENALRLDTGARNLSFLLFASRAHCRSADRERPPCSVFEIRSTFSRAFPRAKSRPGSERRPRLVLVNALSIRARSKIARYAHIAGGADVRYRRRLSDGEGSRTRSRTGRSREIGIFTLRVAVLREMERRRLDKLPPDSRFRSKSIIPHVSVSPLHSTPAE